MVCCDKVRRTVKTVAAAAAAGVNNNATTAVAFALKIRRDADTINDTVVAHCLCCLSESSLAEVLFNFCASKCGALHTTPSPPFFSHTHTHTHVLYLRPDCAANSHNNMPALPQGAFAACKIRAQESRRMPVAQVPSATAQPDNKPTTELFPSWKLIDLSPLKYNSKFMNAIWGHYNRYSPHNIKSNDGARQADVFAARQQQQ